MDLTPIISRLAGAIPKAKQVQFAIGVDPALQDAYKQQKGDVWIYIMPLSERFASVKQASGETDPLDGQEKTRQLGSVQFSALIISKNARDRRGKASTDELNAVLKPLRARLMGWTPPDCHTPIELQGGSNKGPTQDGYVNVWQEDFSTAYDEFN